MSVQRTEDVPWQDYVDVEDVVMTPYDDEGARRSTRTRPTLQVATSETTPADDDGARQATLMFEPGTDATMELPNGQTKPLGDLEVRATEYTVGADGDEAMPGELPATSAYTYAVEFSVDEAVEAGATDVRFTKPVITYVDNFLGFPAGTVVPAAYYDEEQGRLGAVRERRRDQDRRRDGATRRRDVDTDGDGTSSTTLGIDDAERREARRAVRRRQEPVARRGRALHAVGLQLALRLRGRVRPARRGPPPPPADCPECEGAGSIIGVFNQTLGERLGADRHAVRAALHERPRAGLQGGLPARDPAHRPTRSARRCGASTSRSPSPARRSRQTFERRSRTSTHTFAWDGKDAYGREVEGAQTADGPHRLRLPGRLPGAGRVRGRLRPVRRRAVTRSETGAGEETRREIIAWQEWERPARHARRRLGRARRLDARRPPRLRPAGAHALPRRRHAGSRPRRSAPRSARSPASDPFGWWDDEPPATQHRRSASCAARDAGRRRQHLHRRDRAPTASCTRHARRRDRVRRRRRRPTTATRRRRPRDRRPRLLSPARRRGGRGRHALHLRHRQRPHPPRRARTARSARSPAAATRTRSATAAPPRQASLKQPARARARRRRHALRRRGRPRPRAPHHARRPHRDRRRRRQPRLGDGGRAVDATLDLPTDVAVDADGTLYIADARHTPRPRACTATGDDRARSPATAAPGYDRRRRPGHGRGDRPAVRPRRRPRRRRLHRRPRCTTSCAASAPTARSPRFAGTGAAAARATAARRSRPGCPSRRTSRWRRTAPSSIADAGNGRVRRAARGLPGFTRRRLLAALRGRHARSTCSTATGRHLRTVDALTGVAALALRLRRRGPAEQASPTATATSPRSSATAPARRRRSSRPATSARR